MASKVTGDFKAAFALLLSIMKITYGVDPSLNYSQTVYEWTVAGLMTEGLIEQRISEDGKTIILIDSPTSGKNYAPMFNFAKNKYEEAVSLIATQASAGRKAWTQSEILARCFDINQAIFPIALKEGLLDLKDIAAGIGAGAAGIPMEKDR